MITRTQLVQMSEEFIEILTSRNIQYDLWKDSLYITVATTDDGKFTVCGHKGLDEVKKEIASNIEDQTGWFTTDVWDLKQKVRLLFKVNTVVTIDI